MEQLIEVFLKWLKDAGFSAVRAMPEGMFPQLSDAVVAVSIAKAKAEDAGFFSYLGLMERDGTLRALYGKALETEVSLKVVSPQTLGAAACMQQADALLTKLSQPIAGVTLLEILAGECKYEMETDVFSCTLTAKAKTYLYAVSNEEETEFTEFILKGEVQ